MRYGRYNSARSDNVVLLRAVEVEPFWKTVHKMANAQPFVPALDSANADPDRGSKYDFPRDLIGYGRYPPHAQWPNGAKIAVSFVINYEEVEHIYIALLFGVD